MGEFRIGRTLARHVYPEAPRGSANALTAFARNFATGPKNDVTIDVDPGTQVAWNAIDVAPSTPSVDVPITTRSTGIVLVSGVITIENSTGSTISVVIHVQVGGVSLPVPLNQQATIQDGQIVDIPFLAETTPTDTPVGTTSNIEVLLTGAGGVVLSEMSSMSVQEVSVATG